MKLDYLTHARTETERIFRFLLLNIATFDKHIAFIEEQWLRYLLMYFPSFLYL